uniref:MADS-box domain-containing protein n=1 Tax=Oryza nivara TaxID=4536 RepID=A0A0E0FLA3_ORYNI
MAGRKETVIKMAKELSVLCDVPVALVCAVGGAVEVWESEEGVLDRYRALPPEVRATRAHTHRGYLERELRARRSKLAKVREEGAFKSWGRDALSGIITAEEAPALLESIDAAIAAATARQEALALLDGGGLHLQHVPASASDAVAPVVGGHGVQVQYIGGSGGGGGSQQEMTPAADGDGARNADQYDDILPWDGNTFEAHNAHVMLPACGFQCTGDYRVDMDGYVWGAPDDANAYHGWPDEAMWCTDESCSCNAATATAVPAMYHPPTLDTVHGSFLAAPAQPLAFSTGADFINAPNDFLTVGVGGSFINVGDYSAQSLADEFHHLSDATNQLDQTHYPPFGGTGGAEPGDTLSHSWGDYYLAQSSANECQLLGVDGGDIHLDQTHCLGGAGGAEPGDTKSHNWDG